MKTGQLLRRIVLGDGLSNTACLRGYSYRVSLFALRVRFAACATVAASLLRLSYSRVFFFVNVYVCAQGVLFVLLQHQLLSSLEEEEEEKEAKAKDEIFSEEEKEEEGKKTALFSLVAVNPLSSKSVLATRLYPPKAWSGR